jgi:NAD(P)H-dependent FMN reductase
MGLPHAGIAHFAVVYCAFRHWYSKGTRMGDTHILVMAGSSRQGALSHKLAAFAARRHRDAGGAATLLDLRALALPLYDGDLESTQGVPAGAFALQKAIVQCDALLIATPEYNGFPTPLVINAFDWLSRIAAGADHPAGLASTANKPAALLSSSPGAAGGLRAMNYLRQYLQMAFAMIVVPQQFALGRAHEAFDEAGALKDAGAGKAVDAVLQSVSRLARAVKSGA